LLALGSVATRDLVRRYSTGVPYGMARCKREKKTLLGMAKGAAIMASTNGVVPIGVKTCTSTLATLTVVVASPS